MNAIVPEMYMPDKRDNYSGMIASFGDQITQLFSMTDYFRLFQNIQPIKKTIPISSVNAPPVGDCFCKWQSTCAGYADTAGPDCITGQNGCTSTNTGCGFLWLSSCTGACGRLP